MRCNRHRWRERPGYRSGHTGVGCRAGSPKTGPCPAPPAQDLEDTLLLVYAAPLATVGKLARFSRVSASTLRDRLGKLVNKGLVDSVAHRLCVLGPHPQRRYFPTEQGIDAGGMAERGRETFLREYPVSKEWFRLLAERLDAIAVLYRVAALVADADPHKQPVRVDHYRQGPYDVLTTLSGGRSVGILRQGATLPSANLRYCQSPGSIGQWSPGSLSHRVGREIDYYPHISHINPAWLAVISNRAT